jgi:hypothetical protein
VRGEIVENDMDLAVRIDGDDFVQEVEELNTPASFVMAADGCAAGKIKGGEERRRPVPFVIVRLAGCRIDVNDETTSYVVSMTYQFYCLGIIDFEFEIPVGLLTLM